MLNEEKNETQINECNFFHKLFKIGEKVRVKSGFFGPDLQLQNLKGEIIGVASEHVFITYIVFLDTPLNNGWTGITVSGCGLESFF
jgi:hypothetical protein